MSCPNNYHYLPTMNFLGHLYFSNNDLQIMQANLFGDFVKGKDLSKYPDKIQQGILLHRKIDNYIDHHLVVLGLISELYKFLPKVAPIAVDLYFDHLLAKKWSEFHTVKLDDFIQQFYTSLDPSTTYYTEQFQFMLTKMQEKNWLYNYQFLEGLEKMSNGVSRRISFPNKLSDAALVYQQYEQKIEETFYIYMKDARHYFSIQ